MCSPTRVELLVLAPFHNCHTTGPDNPEQSLRDVFNDVSKYIRIVSVSLNAVLPKLPDNPDMSLAHERKSRDDMHYSRTVLFVSFSRRGVARITVLAFLPPIPVDLFSCHQLGVSGTKEIW